MVKIPAGKFLMGSTPQQISQAIKDGADKDWVQNETPQHSVQLSEYSIGKYPITNREFQTFVRDSKYKPPQGWDGEQFSTEKGSHPVVNISWDDATAYCKWLSKKSGKQYRLPTEAEWEKAARWKPSLSGKGQGDGKSLVYPWGNKFDPQKANTDEAQIGDTSDVGKFSPQGDSPYGCADMAGNVWEWCDDWLDENEYKKRNGDIKNPQGNQTGTSRVLRGGSFGDDFKSARSADRYGDLPSYLGWYYGFRVATSPIKLGILEGGD
jgi:formylglycine-generating enzyme required for sulfatase activity